MADEDPFAAHLDSLTDDPGPDPFAAHLAEVGAAPPTPPADRSFLARTKDRVVASVKNAVAHPVDETKRELSELIALGGNAADTATFGLYRRARDALNGLVSPQLVENMHAEEDRANAEHPLLANASRAAGYFSPVGGPAMMARGAGLGVRALTGAAAPAVARVLASRPVAGALVGGLSSGATTLGEDLVAGAPLDWQTAKRALGSGAVGAAIGGALGAGGSVADLVNESRGAQARRLIEERGGGATVSPLSPGKGGVFDRELAGVPANDKGIGKAARIAADKTLEQIAADHRAETSRPYKVMKEQIDNSPAGQAARDVAPIVAKMQDAVNDLETAPFVRSQLEGELKILDKFRDPQSGAVMLSERQLNGLRRGLMRSAKIGSTEAPREAEAPLRAAAFEAKKMVDEGPYQALNKFYAEGAKKLETQRTQLALRPKAPKDSAVDARKLKLSLLRDEANSQTAGGDNDLAAFRAANPDLASTLDLPALARARADLSYRLIPHHGGLMVRTAGATLGPGAAALALAAGHGPAGLAGAGGILALQNATPIAGRLLYPMTSGVAPLPLEQVGRLSAAGRRRALGEK